MSTSTCIANAMAQMLSASNYFGTCMVSVNDYAVLERASGSCAMILFANVQSIAVAFGNDRERAWQMTVTAYSRDTDNPQDVLGRINSMADNIIQCFEADDTVLGAVDSVTRISATRNQNSFVQAGGATWLPLEVLVELREL